MPEVELDPRWDWVVMPWGVGLQCQPLAGVAAHVFTTREPELKSGLPGAEAGWDQLASALGVPAGRIVQLEQVHGRNVLVAGDGLRQPGASGRWGAADAAVTRHGSLALSVSVADCVPALLADRSSGAVAAVHAGWRGTCAGVAGAAIEALASAFGTRPSDVVVAIGPSIGPCCYRVGGEVEEAFGGVAAWQPFLANWLAPAPPRPARRGIPGVDPAASGRRSRFLDTWTANADQFATSGVPRGQIHVSGLCTSCYREVFHSYRVDGSHSGRMVGAIRPGCGR
ncbi:MAG: peptidoglycan editing factor PgeF [Acidobacteriota bacterium]